MESDTEIDPCALQAARLREAIKDWVEASEATRKYVVNLETDVYREPKTFPPGYFQEMEAAYGREQRARARYKQANLALYECKEKHGLID
jgi:hypothetical protein